MNYTNKNYSHGILFTLNYYIIFILGAVMIGGTIYIVGGQSQSTCEGYNPKTDKWFYLKNSVLTENDCCGTLFVTALSEDSQLSVDQVADYYSY